MSDRLWHALSPHIQTYKLNFNRAVPITARQFRLEGRTGTFEATVTNSNQATAKRVVADWVAQQGMRRVQRHLQNIYRERCRSVGQNEVLYIANMWDGKPLEVNPEDIHQAAENLARLHNAMDGCQEEIDLIGHLQNRHGKWLEGLNKAQTEINLERQLTDSHSREHQPSDWQHWLNRWSDLGAKAIKVLGTVNYEKWSDEARQEGTLAWNGYRLQNLTRLNDEQLAVNQPFAPVRDHPLYDLAAFCVDIVNDGQGEAVIETVETYALHRHITSQDRAVVLSFLAFPHQGLRLMQALYAGRLDMSENEEWEQQAEGQLLAGEKLLEAATR